MLPTTSGCRTAFLMVACLFWLAISTCSAFSVGYLYKTTPGSQVPTRPYHRLAASSDDNNTDETKPPNVGDPLRAATGIRPSLHPTAINAIAQALKLRAKGQLVVVAASNGGGTALDLAMQAGTIAAEAIQQRQSKSTQDGMTLTKEEEQTIAGRVVGVVMRLAELEAVLASRVQSVSWIAKYGEWDTFGVAPEETNDGDADEMIQQRVKDDPLFGMNRAECLLALFLQSVEIPQLEKVGQAVPDKSVIDFLDEDRKEVLLQQ